jgi:hypothetical protein
MTAAPETLTAPISRTERERSLPRVSLRWKRILVVLAVCLPVPLSAATGLSVPLPDIVQRIAAALVPWADAATLYSNQALEFGAQGSIVLMPYERHGNASDQPDTRAARPVTPTAAADVGGAQKDPAPGGNPAKNDSGAIDSGTTEPGGTGGGPGPGGETESPSNDPLQPVVDEVNDTTNDVVETGSGVVNDAGDAVEDAVDDVTGLLGK